MCLQLILFDAITLGMHAHAHIHCRVDDKEVAQVRRLTVTITPPITTTLHTAAHSGQGPRSSKPLNRCDLTQKCLAGTMAVAIVTPLSV